MAEKLAHVAASVSTVARRLVSLVFLCAFTRDIIESEMLHLERKCKRSVDETLTTVRIGPKSELNKPQCEGTHTCPERTLQTICRHFFSKELRNTL